MTTKLTLRLDETLIRQAKWYSKKTGKSLSQIVADYFAMLDGEVSTRVLQPLPPVTRSLKGFLKKAKIKVSEADYRRHLEEKYL